MEPRSRPGPIIYRPREQVYDPTSIGEFWDELGSYQHPQNGPNEFWYKCAIRKCVVYLRLDKSCRSQDIIREAMKYALHQQLEALKVRQPTSTRWEAEYEPCSPKSIDGGSRFNVEYHTIVDFSELTFVSAITLNVNVVELNGVKYIYKYMRPGNIQLSWEREFRNYMNIQRCKSIPSLIAIVRRDGAIRGLLLSFIDGENLGDLDIKSDSERLDITYRIISVAVNLEKVDYYHGDLKCGNILRRKADGDIYFIDFAGGATKGFYPQESEWKILCGDVNPKDGVYILGKALWQLWTNPSGIPEEILSETIPYPVHDIIHDCCIARNVADMNELYGKWCSEAFQIESKSILVSL